MYKINDIQFQEETDQQGNSILSLDASQLENNQSYDFKAISASTQILIQGDIPQGATLEFTAGVILKGNMQDSSKLFSQGYIQINGHVCNRCTVYNTTNKRSIIINGNSGLGSYIRGGKITVNDIHQSQLQATQSITVKGIVHPPRTARSSQGSEKTYSATLTAPQISYQKNNETNVSPNQKKHPREHDAIANKIDDSQIKKRKLGDFSNSNHNMQDSPNTSLESPTIDSPIEADQTQATSRNTYGHLNEFVMPEADNDKIMQVAKLYKRLQLLHEQVNNDEPPTLTDDRNNKITLRPYQLRAMTEYCNGLMQGKKDAVFDFPTGAGKTVVFATMLGLLHPETKSGGKILIVVPRIDLLEQTIDAIHLFAPHLTIGEYSSDKKDSLNYDIIVTTYQSLQADNKKEHKQFDFSQFEHIVLDEAHNALSKKRVALTKEMRKKGSSILAFTATPDYNTKNKNNTISNVYDLLDYTNPSTTNPSIPNDRSPQNPVSRITIIEAIEAHALAPVRTAVVKPALDLETSNSVRQIGNAREIKENKLGLIINKPAYNAIAVDVYANEVETKTGKRFLGEQGVVFCAGIQHAKDVAKAMKKSIPLNHPFVSEACKKYVERMREKYKQENKYFPENTIRKQFKVAASVHSKKKNKRKNKELLQRYKDGGILVLTGADKLTEGFDHKATSVVLNMRATKSSVVKIQSSGRGLRLDPENPNKITKIIDWDWGINGQLYFSNIIDGNKEFGEFNQPAINHTDISQIEIRDAAKHSGLQWEHSQTIAYYKSSSSRRSGSPRNPEQRETDMMQTAAELEQSLVAMEDVLNNFKTLLDNKKPEIIVIDPTESKENIPNPKRSQAKQHSTPKPIAQDPMDIDQPSIDVTEPTMTRGLEKRLATLGNRVENTNQQISDILALLFNDDECPEVESDSDSSINLEDSDDESSSSDQQHKKHHPKKHASNTSNQAENLSAALSKLNGLKNKISSLTNWIQGAGNYAPGQSSIGSHNNIEENTDNGAEERYKEIEDQLQAVLIDMKSTQQVWHTDNLKQLVDHAVKRREEIQARKAQAQPQTEPVAEMEIAPPEQPQTSTVNLVKVTKEMLLEYCLHHRNYLNKLQDKQTISPEEETAKGSLNEYVGGIADLREIDLKSMDLSKANLQKVNLHGANLNGANLQSTDLSKANLQKVNLHGANLNGANLNGANLQSTDLSRANLCNANLANADLNGANLNAANLNGAILQSTDLSRANLCNAILANADLNGANLVSANLSGADFSGTNLQGAIFLGVNLEHCKNFEDHQNIITKPERLLSILQNNTFPDMKEKHKTAAKALLNGRVLDLKTFELSDRKKFIPIELTPETRQGLLNILNPQQAQVNLVRVTKETLLKYCQLHRSYLNKLQSSQTVSPEEEKAKRSLNEYVGGIADLSSTDLRSTNLRNANLCNANLNGANLNGAHLNGANLQGANLQNTILSFANLQCANLYGANLQVAILLGANLYNCRNFQDHQDIITTPERLLSILQNNTFPDMKEKHKTAAKALLNGRVLDLKTFELSDRKKFIPIELTPETRQGLLNILNPQQALNNSSTFFSDPHKPTEENYMNISKDNTPVDRPNAFFNQ